ncbi:hypothetical protein BO82DRAFT_338874 [Aspergillus uvarum CBS 121591]|uniref:Uncharacterized protein n=1 Tax=Aspergillus uvarum CBS 121591 TaxID=1448315 RepID=A0A319CNC3_9EURO|nr:hypothetical protein BO82DRAFT_338874 [Aspergillus uvarum CBS 121591]PYH80213.1 hypothetical protein BO82DRAFT_338874 [Aspergillus uvarum CBS 121591]
MTRSSVNSDLMRRPRNMGVLSTLLLPCIQVRKLRRSRRQRDHHTSWSCAGIAEFEEQHQQHQQQGTTEKKLHTRDTEGYTELSSFPEKPQPAATMTATTLTHTKSIRLVSCADSECSTLGPDDGPILEKDDEAGDQEREDFLAGKESASESGNATLLSLLSDEETDVEQSGGGSPPLVQKIIAMEVVPSSRPPSRAGAGAGTPKSKDDLDLELASRRVPKIQEDRRPRPASMQVHSTGGALKLPEIKSRVIDDIPEDIEEDVVGVRVRPLRQAARKSALLKPTVVEGEDDDDDDENDDKKRSSTWRLSQRKSMIELFSLLQSTAAAVAAAPKFSNLKLPLTQRSPFRFSTNAVVDASPSSKTKLPSPPPPTPPPKSPKQLLQQRPLPQTPQRKPRHSSFQEQISPPTATYRTSPSPSPTKKQRRMGTVLFPLTSSFRPTSGGNNNPSVTTTTTTTTIPESPSRRQSRHQTQNQQQKSNAQTLFC